MLTYDTVRSIDAVADTRPTYEEQYAVRRLATLVSCTVSARDAMQRTVQTWGDSERGTYGAGYADGVTLADGLSKVIEEALAAYVGTQVKL